MMAIGSSQALLLAVLALGGSLRAHSAVSEEANAAADGPGRGALAGFVVTPQTDAGGNRALLLAPDSAWFLATSPGASTARLIDINSGITLRHLTRPGLHIAALTISPDSKTVFARDYDGQIVAWDAATGQLVPTAPPIDFHDITRLSLNYEGGEPVQPTPEFLARYHLQSHFPDLKRHENIALNPTQEYAIIGYIGDPRWNAFQIWNLKKERTELFFRLDENICGYPPFSFDYDGKHLIFGNTRGESYSNHLDFTVFRIDNSGPTFAPGSAEASHPKDRCRFPPDFDVGLEQNFNISPGAQLITKGEGMPGTPEWAAWDLRNGQKVASIHPDGYGVVSSDGSTFVVLHSRETLGAPPNRLTIQRSGKQETFKIPRSLQSDGLLVVVSSNGRWIALQLAETVVVWSATDGRVVKEYQIGRPAIMLRVSDQGDPLLVDDKSGAAFANGKWRAVRTVEHGLIAPLTPNFHAQCGAIFCDRVVAELGVVERQSRDDRARNAARLDLSPDGRFMIVRTVDKADNVSHDVIDIADGHVVLHDQTGNFASDGRSLVVRENDENGDAGFVKYDLPTGKRIWTATPNRAEDGFYMIFPDGRVRFSAGRSVDLMLVRGFEVRYFDATAVKQFVVPPDADEAR
jgi:WD40 repeat protein